MSINTLKSIKTKTALFPMPVLIIATYGEDEKVNAMNMAWGGIYDDDKVVLNLSPGHKTAKNIDARKAFTLSVADLPNLKAADYVGIASGNKVDDKFQRSGLSAVKSENVDAPVIVDFPITLECELVETYREPETVHYIGKIVNTLVAEKILGEDGKVDPTKINAILYDTFQHGYYAVGERVGNAFSDGKELAK